MITDMGDIQNQLLKMVEEMPAFPNSVHRILELTTDINCSTKELVGVIHHDPVMTLKILRLVNSSYFGFSRQVSTINQAVVCVGINTIKNLAIGVASMGVLSQRNEAGMDMQELLVHSLGVAIVAKMIGQRMGVGDAACNDYFVAGLLHDIGKAVFAQYLPNVYRQVLQQASAGQVAMHIIEQDSLGADHGQLGSLLMEKWQLPQVFIDSIRDHHQPTDANSPAAMAIFAADQVARTLRFGSAGNLLIEVLPDFIVQRLGLNLAGLIDSLNPAHLASEMEKARVFMRL